METVYVVTAGEYSDYHIERIFSRREEADDYCAALNESDRWGSGRVVEWPVDSEPVAWGTVFHARWIWHPNGPNDPPEIITTSEENQPIPTGGISVSEEERDGYWGTFVDIGAISDNPERALKSVADRRAKYIATRAGIA